MWVPFEWDACLLSDTCLLHRSLLHVFWEWYRSPMWVPLEWDACHLSDTHLVCYRPLQASLQASLVSPFGVIQVSCVGPFWVMYISFVTGLYRDRPLQSVSFERNRSFAWVSLVWFFWALQVSFFVGLFRVICIFVCYRSVQASLVSLVGVIRFS